MGAQLELQSNVHSLVLEDIEHLVQEIHCSSDATVAVKFYSEHFQHARRIIEEKPDILIITSHAGCNEAGTRMPYR